MFSLKCKPITAIIISLLSNQQKCLHSCFSHFTLLMFVYIIINRWMGLAAVCCCCHNKFRIQLAGNIFHMKICYHTTKPCFSLSLSLVMLRIGNHLLKSSHSPFAANIKLLLQCAFCFNSWTCWLLFRQQKCWGWWERVMWRKETFNNCLLTYMR